MPSSTIGASGNADIDGLLHGTKWLDGTTFSFPDAASDYAGGAREAGSGFAPISQRQQQELRFVYDGTAPTLPGLGQAMSVAHFTNIKLAFVGHDTAEMRAGESSVPPTAYANYPGNGYAAAGDVWFGTAFAGTANDYRDPVLGGYAYLVHIHEALHSLGLKHGDEAGGVAGAPVTAAHNSLEYSIVDNMGFLGKGQSGYGFSTWDAPQTPMLLDVQALQYLYGANYSYNSGDTVYRWSPSTGELTIDGVGQGRPGGNKVFMTLWDGGGTDTYDLSDYGAGVTIDLNPGAWSTFGGGQLAYLGYEDGDHYAAGNVANAYMHGNNPASLVENARGGSGDDRIIGNGADNRFFAGAGNDNYEGGAGHDVLDAGLCGYRGSNKGLGAQGELRLDTKGGRETLTGVEEVLFADGVLHTTQDSHAAQVYRLYAAGLDRGPDQTGQTHWTGMLDSGARLKELAQGFLHSREFAVRFGGADSPVDAYVSQLYRNLLHRDGDDAGKAFWREQLASGRADRADVLVGFSESAENKAGTAEAVAAGVWVMDRNAPGVARMYDTVFGRQPDEAGLKHWCDRLDAGDIALKGLASRFVQSPEFSARFGSLGDSDFVENMYLHTLHRSSDAAGKANWVGALQAGAADRADVVVGFSESAEHQDATRDLNLSGNALNFGIAFA